MQKTPGNYIGHLQDGYLPHVNGIRALAVIPVLFFHFDLPFFEGGFSGVDVFFVISGYLITGGILKNLAANEFSIGAFYRKRIKRILPAYFAAVAIVMITSIMVYTYPTLRIVSWSALSSAFFSTNIRFSLDRDYFAPNAREDPLLHLWSLGIEEQFYLVIPILLIFLWKKWPSFINDILILLLVASFIPSEFLVNSESSKHVRAAFYYPHLRSWEFLAGAVLSMARPRTYLNKNYSNALGLIGFLSIVCSYVFLTDELPFPGLMALPAVIGTVLLIRFGNVGYVNSILTTNFFQFTGRISYSLYLWHWPIAVFYRYVKFGAITAFDILIILSLSFLAGWVSWRWIEAPFRVAKVSRTYPYYFAMAGCLTLAVVAAFIIFTNGGRNYFNVSANRLVNENETAALVVWKGKNLFMKTGATKITTEELLKDSSGDALIIIGKENCAPTFLLWGDSHAGASIPGLSTIAEKRSKCGYLLNRQHGLSPNRFQYYDSVLKWLAWEPGIKHIFLIQRWSYRLKEEVNRAFLKEVCKKLISMHKNVTILTSLPEYAINPVLYQARKKILWFIDSSPMEPMVTEAEYNKASKCYHQLFTELKEKYGIQIISIEDPLKVADHYVAMKNGILLYSDDNHLSPKGAEYVYNYLAPQLFSLEQ